jgi:hypothetical protein
MKRGFLWLELKLPALYIPYPEASAQFWMWVKETAGASREAAERSLEPLCQGQGRQKEGHEGGAGLPGTSQGVSQKIE